jgi:hypothetical protein
MVGREMRTINFVVDDIIKVLDEAPAALVVGTGYEGLMMVLPEVKELLTSKGIILIIEKTSMVYKIFNTLVKIKRVVGAFHITC